ncbi:phospholipid scramblase 1, partial [Cichlidogyrus casuarinus]
VNTNLTLAINSAASIGCCVTNVGPTDIQEQRKHIILGLIWQLIRKCIVDSVTLAKHGELAALLRDGETLDDLSKLKPEELLMRWVNFQLERAGCNRRMKNFNDDIHDSEIYSYLMNQISPDHMKKSMITKDETMGKGDLKLRANDIWSNANTMDCGSLITPEAIFMAKDPKERNDNLHLGFVATLFNMYPAMDPPAEPVDLTAYEETLEEKTYRNWMNSLGVTPYVNHLYTGLQDGLVLLQLLEMIHPNSVNWKIANNTFDVKKVLYQKTSNCNLFVDSARKQGIKLVNISGNDIFEENKKLVLGTCFSLMQAYLYTLLKKVRKGSDTFKADEKEILNWTNQMLAQADEPEPPLANFRDKRLLTSWPICAVVNSIVPGTACKDQMSSDNFQNAVYSLSCARKAGAKVYALPEHIVNMDGKMIMTIFVCLMIEYHTRQAIINGDQVAATGF